MLSSFGQQYSRVAIDMRTTSFQELQAIGIPIEGVVQKQTLFITELSEHQIEALKNKQIPFTILIEDVQQFYQQRNQNEQIKNVKGPSCYAAQYYQTPVHFHTGSMGGFLTYQEILNELDSMKTLYPHLISTKQPIGTFVTHNNNQIYYVKISDNPHVSEAEPKILYIALMHAREAMGMQQMIYFMWYLLENYNKNQEIKFLVDNLELYFVPCANPDGYIYNQYTDPAGGGMWRKNRRNNGDGSYGVDLNRNFGFMWGYDDNGSSPIPGMETYRGPAAFSEPETQAIKFLCETIQPMFILDYHTYSDVLLYPWGYINEKTPDSTLYDLYASKLTEENYFPYGNPFGLIGYNANGGSMDWYYGEQTTKNKIINWVPELGSIDDGFWPAIYNFEYLAKQCMSMNLNVARFALHTAQLKDLTTDWFTNTSTHFLYSLTRLGMMNNQSFTVSIQPISSNIISVGQPKQYVLNQFQTVYDSISITLDPSILNGDTITFVVQLYNGQVTINDTIRKIYGSPVTVFYSDGSNLNGWSGNWFVTTSSFHSPPSSITDSPFGNYMNNTTRTITSDAINLSNAVAARLTFWCKWDIEPVYDYVQLSISTDNGQTWSPLCGKYTKPGKSYQDHLNPIYDGTQSQWVQEYINLNNWISQTVRFRFKLQSDGWITADGFYFDDFHVEIIPQSIATVNDETTEQTIIYPNPATTSIHIHASAPISLLQVIDLHGQKIMEKLPQQNAVELNVHDIPTGVYLLVIHFSHQTLFKRFIKLPHE